MSGNSPGASPVSSPPPSSSPSAFTTSTSRAPGNGRLAARIRAAFDEAERLRAGGAPIGDIRAFINPKLAAFRETIRAISFRPEFERALDARLAEIFGPDGSYGVFVRSDTNAEDLPQFTGAGLNLTVPNVTGRARILQAIRDVWASPFEERAYEWRSRALAPGSDVLPLRPDPANRQ
jgi:hypothetical protein